VATGLNIGSKVQRGRRVAHDRARHAHAARAPRQSRRSGVGRPWVRVP
jgi:hypothetical protein